MWVKQLCRLPVAWAEQGDEWALHLSAVLTGQSQMMALNARGAADHAWVIFEAPAGVEVCGQLAVTPSGGEIVCAAIGEGEEPDDACVAAWKSAAVEAAQRLGAPRTAFAWYAIVGTSPYGSIGGESTPVALAAPTKVGPLLLTPGGVLMHEAVAHPPLNIASSARMHYSWPLYVQGQAESYDQLAALGQSRRPARRISALLSLAWDRWWTVRLGPNPVGPDGEKFAVPTVVGGVAGSPWASAGPITGDAAQRMRDAREAPGWLDAAWALLESDAVLDGALDIFFEALALEDQHPSLAFMAYVAAVEAVGPKQVELTRCECCDECTITSGAIKRFRKALKTVMTNKQVDAFYESAYESRSGTAHVGTLHGTESTLGWASWSMFRDDAHGDFSYASVTDMRNACRSVLTHALTQEHPGTQ